MERLKLIIMSASPVPVGRGFRVVGGRGSHMSANGETEWNKGFKMSPVKRQATSLPATDREVSPCGAIVSSLPGGVCPRGERPGEVEEPLLLLIDRLFFLFFFFSSFSFTEKLSRTQSAHEPTLPCPHPAAQAPRLLTPRIGAPHGQGPRVLIRGVAATLGVARSVGVELTNVRPATGAPRRDRIRRSRVTTLNSPRAPCSSPPAGLPATTGLSRNVFVFTLRAPARSPYRDTVKLPVYSRCSRHIC